MGKFQNLKTKNQVNGWKDRVEILAWPASGVKRVARKIQFSIEELIGG